MIYAIKSHFRKKTYWLINSISILTYLMLINILYFSLTVNKDDLIFTISTNIIINYVSWIPVIHVIILNVSYLFRIKEMNINHYLFRSETYNFKKMTKYFFQLLIYPLATTSVAINVFTIIIFITNF